VIENRRGFLRRRLPYIIYIMLDGGKDRFFATVFFFSIKRVGYILLISMYISIKCSIHFGGLHLFQTFFGRHQSHLFYHYFHFISYHFKEI
jgi:hypothetical protein